MIESESDLRTLLSGIADLFRIVKCDNTPILDLLGRIFANSNYPELMLFMFQIRKVRLTTITSWFTWELSKGG